MIDWEDVRQRLRQSEMALDQTLNAGDARLQAVYRQRAVQLAARQRHTAAAAGQSVLVFGLGAERYALNMTDVLQVFPLVHCTPVPAAPPQLLGVTNLRGEIRSVLDLRRILDLPVSDADGDGNGESGDLLLVRHHGVEVAMRVDRVESVQRISADEMMGGDASDRRHAAGYVRGVTRDRICLINLAAVFEHPAFAELVAD
jgi:purine-binding chemotaxis protein CheW